MALAPVGMGLTDGDPYSSWAVQKVLALIWGPQSPVDLSLPLDVDVSLVTFAEEYIRFMELDSSANQWRLRLSGMHWCS